MPSINKTVSLGQLQAELHALTNDIVPLLGLNTLRIAMEDLFMDVSRTSPKGSISTSIHPGKYAASHKASVGAPAFADLRDQSAYPRLGITEVSGIAEELSLGQSGYITNDAKSDRSKRPYSDILELGRHVDSLGRQAGSVQAPEGIYGPAILRLITNSADIMARAFKRTLQGVS